MTNVVRAPSRPLAPFVSYLAYYETRFPPVREVLLPTGSMVLVMNLADDAARWYDGPRLATAHSVRGAVVVGPGAGRLGVDLADLRCIIGVLFRPGGAYPFFGPPASAFDFPIVDLEAVWGHHGRFARERVLAAPTPEARLSIMERILVERLTRPLEPDPGIAWAAEALHRGLAVATVADRLGVPDRTLLRRFTTQVGLTPKRYGRVRRLQRLLAWIPDGTDADWARAAVECGYFDQAHLINEFRALTGLTPTVYRARSAMCRNHEAPAG
jgi:AraC-like DNA-binding protein